MRRTVSQTPWKPQHPRREGSQLTGTEVRVFDEACQLLLDVHSPS